jgi:hypothetical protein
MVNDEDSGTTPLTWSWKLYASDMLAVVHDGIRLIDKYWIAREAKIFADLRDAANVSLLESQLAIRWFANVKRMIVCIVKVCFFKSRE